MAGTPWRTRPQVGAADVVDADLLAFSDESLPEGQRSRTLSVGVLRRIVESKVIVTYTGSHTFTPATDLGAHLRFTAAGTFTIPAGLTVGTSWVVGNATTSDTVDIDGSAVTLLSNGVEVDNGGWVAFLVVGSNVVEAVGAFADAPLGSVNLGDLVDVDTTGASDGDVLTYDDGEWIAAAPTGGGGGGTPGGSDTQIQYNDGGAFAGLAGFMLQKTNPRMKIEKTLSSASNTEADDALHVTLTKSTNVTQVPSALHVYAKSAGGGAGSGNLHAISSHIDAFNPTNATDEATPLFLLTTGLGGRLWGTDQNVVGPSATQANVILGASINVMNQNASAATGKVIGVNVTTVKENEAQAVAPTHPGDFGVLVNGRSGTGATTRAGWTVGIGVGQAGGGWLPATVGKIGTGVEVTNIDTLGISYVGTTAAAVGLRVKGAASQSGNLIEVRTSTDAIPARFAAAGNLAFTFGAATDAFLSALVTGDSASRIAVQTGGRIEWGPGSASRDVFLARVAPTAGAGLELSSATATEFVLHSTAAGNTAKSRLQQQSQNAAVSLIANGRFQDGSGWTRDDTAQAMSVLGVSPTDGLRWRVAPSGSNPATLRTDLLVTVLGSVIVGSAALSTSATDGFLYIPTMAGAPSGTPTSHTGTAALVLDTTNNRLYVRSGASWRYATLT
jgi:hypothetical protein